MKLPEACYLFWQEKVTSADRRYTKNDRLMFCLDKGALPGEDWDPDSPRRAMDKLRESGTVNFKSLGDGKFEALQLGESREDDDPRQPPLFDFV